MQLADQTFCLQVYNLPLLTEKLTAMYKSMTEGKFTEGLRLTNALLHMIVLTTVETRREVDELKELLGIVKCVFSSITSAAHCAYDPDRHPASRSTSLDVTAADCPPLALLPHCMHGCIL